MGQNKVELLVELIGKDGITKLLDQAATEALKIERNMKKGSKAGNRLAKSASNIADNFSQFVTGLNQGIELIGRIEESAKELYSSVKKTAEARQLENRFVQQLNVSVEKLQKASGFQLPELEIKRYALQAQQANVTMAQFEQILQISARAAAGSGQEFKEVFEGLFVDTVIGASDSYLENLGIVADMGVETEKWARKNFVLKENIDKTTQSSAMLNVVLGKVNKKFADVKVDQFVSELNRVEQRIQKLNDDYEKAKAFLLQDIAEVTGVTKTGQAVMDQFVKINKELQGYAAGNRKVFTSMQKGTDEFGGEVDITADRVKQLKKELGELAKKSEDVKRIVFEDIAKEAERLGAGTEGLANKLMGLGVNFEFVKKASYDSETGLTAYDQALIRVASQYGLADVAQKEFTTGAKQIGTVFGAIIPRNISIGLGAVTDFVASARTSLSTFLTDPLLLKVIQGDTKALAKLLGFGAKPKEEKKKKPKRGGGGRKSYPDEAQRLLRKQFKVEKDVRQRAIKQRLLDDEQLFKALELSAKRESSYKRTALKKEENFTKAIKEHLRLQADARREGQKRIASDMKLHLESMERKRKAQTEILGGLRQSELESFFPTDDVEFFRPDPTDFADENWLDTQALQMKTLADAMGLVNVAAENMNQAVTQLGGNPGFAQMTKNIGDIAKASIVFAGVNKKTAGTYADLTGAIVTGAGQAALGFVEGEKERAGIMAAMELGQAGVMFAKFAAEPYMAHYAVAGSMHLANSAMFAAIAGGAGAKKGAGASGSGGAGAPRATSGMRDIPQFGQQQPNQQMPPAQVVVNMSGAIVAGANRKKTANDFGNLLEESMAGRR